jgi:thymidylate synthase (FAD)
MQENLNFVLPKVFLIGYTSVDYSGLHEYLKYTNQTEFIEDIANATLAGVSDGEILCSFYAKLCYKSLTTKENKNISKVRSIEDNILSTIISRHGSVFEHCNINFVVTNCSRVYTHEQVRHRVGTAYSQTSGRYVRGNELKIVFDPILNPIYERAENLRQHIENEYKLMEKEMGLNNPGLDFSFKKKVTSALRRFLPNGQANEIGYSVNLRTLRQTIQTRTSRHAEWEIRDIYNQIYEIVNSKYPLMFADAKLEEVDGMNEIVFENDRI